MNNFFCTILAMWLITISVVQAQTNVTSGNIKYKLSGNTATVTGYIAKPTGTLTFPEKLLYETVEYNVGSIDKSAFKDCSNLTGVILPTGLTTIGDQAFYGCSKLVGITFPAGLSSIGNHAFYGSTKLTGITFPAGLLWIGNSAFSGCTGLAQIISNSVAPPMLGTSVFDYRILSTCMVQVPLEVANAYRSAPGWKDLKNINVAIVSGIKYEITNNEATIVGYVNNAPAGVLSISNTVTYLSQNYPVTTIQERAFETCNYLHSVTFPSSINTIENYAFSGCTGLIQITSNSTIPPMLGSSVFSNSILSTCTVQVPIETGNAYRSAPGWKDFKSINIAVVGGIKYQIDNNEATIIGYTNAPIGRLSIPGTVTYLTQNYPVNIIQESAFKSCVNLYSITFPPSITSIGNYAFSGGATLTQIVCNTMAPPVLGDRVFGGVNTATCEVIVPDNSLNAYKSAYGWKDFKNIKETSASGVNVSIDNSIQLFGYQDGIEIQNLTIGSIVNVFDTSGSSVVRKISDNGMMRISLPQGIYIVQTDGLSVRKVIVK